MCHPVQRRVPSLVSNYNGTFEDQIDGIVHWLRHFKPYHLHFLLDLRCHRSQLARNHVPGITSLFQETFKHIILKTMYELF